jgi:phosphatidylserine decarboxylase
VRIHKDGMKFILLAILLTTYAFLEIRFLFYPFFIILLWVIYFFRDPIPALPVNEKIIVSPASGKVVGIQEVIAPEEYELGDQPVTRVSIFLNIFDVHVNRAPVTGTVLKIMYHPGQFLNASLDKASEKNERNAILIQYKGKKMVVTQIAGLIARRILCSVKEGQGFQKGDELGLIRFGSRVDIYFDSTVKPFLQVGQYVRVGETAIYEI